MTLPGDATLPLSEVLRPTEPAEVARIVERAAREATAVYPLGGETSLGYGVRPRRPGLGLSCSGLDRLVDYPVRDLTITVEAGMTVAALARRLAAEGQRLPVDVPQSQRATIGGAVASCLPGPRQFRCGTLRDYVIGLRAVDGGGAEFSAGGRVVKNAAGYDLCRLVTGSLGTLAVVVQVTLMVKPLPETSAILAAALSGWPTAERLLAGLTASRALPTAVELLTGPEWRGDPALGALGSSQAGWLVAGLEGTLGEVEWMIGRLESEWREAGVGAPLVLRGNRAVPLWDRLVEFPAGTGNGTSPLTVQLHGLPSDTVALIQGVLQRDPGASILAHAGNGAIVARLALEPGVALEKLQGELRPEVERRGGSAVILSAPADLPLDGPAVWGSPRPAHAVMQRIKDQFDPCDILNPGRFLFASRS